MEGKGACRHDMDGVKFVMGEKNKCEEVSQVSWVKAGSCSPSVVTKTGSIIAEVYFKSTSE